MWSAAIGTYLGIGPVFRSEFGLLYPAIGDCHEAFDLCSLYCVYVWRAGHFIGEPEVI